MPNPVDVINLQQIETAENTGVEVWGKLTLDPILSSPASLERIATQPDAITGEVMTGAPSVELFPAVATVLAGAELDKYLLNQPWWDNFWLGVGGKLTDIWHSAFHFLEGSPGVSFETLHSTINLNNHLMMRAVRQLYGRLTARLHANYLMNGRAFRFQQREISLVARYFVNHVNWLNKALPALETRVKQYAKSQADAANATTLKRIKDYDSHIKQWISDNVTKPFTRTTHTLDQRITHLQQSIPTIVKPLIATAVAAQLAPFAKTLAQHTKQLSDLQQETDECTKPMCEDIGPKTDWGKLFKKVKPAALLAMLELFAATDPRDIERIAEEVAQAIGPVLEHWVAAYVGVLPGGTSEQPGEVSHEIGPSPFGGIF